MVEVPEALESHALDLRGTLTTQGLGQEGTPHVLRFLSPSDLRPVVAVGG